MVAYVCSPPNRAICFFFGSMLELYFGLYSLVGSFWCMGLFSSGEPTISH